MKVLENVKADPAEFFKVVTKTAVAVKKVPVGAKMVVDPGALGVEMVDVVRSTGLLVPKAVEELGFTSVIDV